MFRTVARSTLILTLAIVLLTGAVVLMLGGSVARAAAWAVALALASRVVPIAGSFVIAYWPRGGPGLPPLGAVAATRMVAREAWATIKLFFFYHPLERLVMEREPKNVVTGETPLLLVHGFYANGGFWQRIKRTVANDGWHNLFALNLEPPFADIDDYAGQLQLRIEAACRRCQSSAVIVVAHSMGGLVARACAARAPGRIAHIVCLGTPHQGTVLAELLPLRTTRQMRPGSAWLHELETRESTTPPLTNIYSEHDNIIVPQVNACRGDNNIAVSGVGHMDMAFSFALQQKLRQALKEIQLDVSP